ncbi:MAG: endonuclease/exonuclease/phosphatase family protein, partial [Paracoccaceae bacterium]
MIKRIAILAGCLSTITAIAGFFGHVHPIGDSLAVFQLPLALIGAVLLWRAPLVLLTPAACIAAISVAIVFTPKLSTATPGPYTVYQKNLLYKLDDPQLLIDDILTRLPDVVMMQEVGEANQRVLEGLKEAYPNQLHCPYGSIGGTAVMTRWPVTGETECAEFGGLSAIKALSPEGPVWLVSLPLRWPYPYPQSNQVWELRPILQALDAPIILAGDFNMVPWSHSVRTILRATGTRYSGV